MDAVDRFAALLDRDESRIDLGSAAFALAALEYPDLDVAVQVQRLDRLAGEASRVLRATDPPRRHVAAINRVLFDEYGLRGNRDDYYDPRNSYLNEVLDRRLGIPITLSVIYMEVGRRLGLTLRGVGLPGHFLVRVATADEPLLVDPFGGGRLLDTEDCAALLRDVHGSEARLDPAMLRSVGTRAILYRMVTNLKLIYGRRQDLARAIRCLDALLLMEPGATREYRDRGLARLRAGDLKGARADLVTYTSAAPNAADAAVIQGQIQLVDQLTQRLN
ncbi:MAG: transglutaminase-like domain-containing protein [Chloroflexota bacterium]